MNSGNGGPPGIQTWTNRYQRTIQLLLILIGKPDHRAKVGLLKSDIYYTELKELGIIDKIDNMWILNIDNMKKYSTVVPDSMYENFKDINWLREQRKKLGIIKGEVKDEVYRQNQQSRRKKRRAYAKEQKAKLLAQPSEELPLSEIIFYEAETKQEQKEIQNNKN